MNLPLTQVKSNLLHIKKNLTWQISDIGVINVTKIKGLESIRLSVKVLDKLKLFPTLVELIKTSFVFSSIEDTVNAQSNEVKNLEANLKTLTNLVNNLYMAISNVLPNEDTNSINIKLPPVNDFEELSKFSHQIHLALSQILVNEEIGGQTKINSVENGSIWLNVSVGTTKAMVLIASLLWSSAVIYKKYEEGRLIEEKIRGLEIKNESLNEILEATKKQTNLLIEAEAKFVHSENFTNNNPENIERLKQSIKTFAELIQKGAEVHPSLEAPEEASNLFPNPTNLLGVESKIKKLESPQ